MSAIFLIPGCTVKRPRGILKIYSALLLILTVSHSDNRSIVRVPRQLNLASPISNCMFCDFFFFFFYYFQSCNSRCPSGIYIYSRLHRWQPINKTASLHISLPSVLCILLFTLRIFLPPGWTAELPSGTLTGALHSQSGPSLYQSEIIKITHVYDLRIKL